MESAADAYSFPPIPPDLPLCADCARELLAPDNRRLPLPVHHLHAVRTAVLDRRAHAVRPAEHDHAPVQPVSRRAPPSTPTRRIAASTRRPTPAHGAAPRSSAVTATANRLPGDPLAAAVAALGQGKVAAIQGIGGFHLAADPRAPGAMERLRRDKERERKPFALMVRDLEEARALCVLSETEEKLLASPEAPILIAPRRDSAPAWTRACPTRTRSGVDAALHAPAPSPLQASPAGDPLACTGHDLRQPGRRADHHRSRRGPREARRRGRCIPLPRPAYRVPHRRFGRSAPVQPSPPVPAAAVARVRSTADPALAGCARRGACAGRRPEECPGPRAREGPAPLRVQR